MPNDDKNKVMTELEVLQLEEARYRVSQLQGAQRIRARKRASFELSIRAEAERDAIKQSRCAHKKGGKGVEMIYQGNDHNYAVIKHVYAHGELRVYCQRCGKEWKAPDPKLNSKGATVEERREYARLYHDYVQAVNFPTDNETSGSQLFMVTRGEPGTSEAFA